MWGAEGINCILLPAGERHWCNPKGQKLRLAALPCCGWWRRAGWRFPGHSSSLGARGASSADFPSYGFQDSISLLLEAVRTKNEEHAQTWKKSEQWATIEQLCSKKGGPSGRGVPCPSGQGWAKVAGGWWLHSAALKLPWRSWEAPAGRKLFLGPEWSPLH